METIKQGYYRLKKNAGACYKSSREEAIRVDPLNTIKFNIFLLKEDTIIYLTGYDSVNNQYEALLGGRPILMYAGTDFVRDMFELVEGQEKIVEILYDNKK